MSRLAGAWFVARKDLQYLLRSKETILWVFIMPIVFFYLIGTITGGFAEQGESLDELAVAVAEQFDVDEATARGDVQVFMDEIAQLGMVE